MMREMDIKDVWEADRLRTERVRATGGSDLDDLLAQTFGDALGEWWDASASSIVALAALKSLMERHGDRADAFAQRLLDEVAPWAEMDSDSVRRAKYHEGIVNARPISHVVLSILGAEPASIVRAIILALPERGGRERHGRVARSRH